MEMQEGGGLFKGVASEKGGQLGVNRGHCRVWAGGVVVGGRGWTVFRKKEQGSASEKQDVPFGRVIDPFLMACHHPSPDHSGEAQHTLPGAS